MNLIRFAVKLVLVMRVEFHPILLEEQHHVVNLNLEEQHFEEQHHVIKLTLVSGMK